MGLFGFLDMQGTYDERKVANFTKDDLQVDTAMVTDGRQPYETGIQWPSEYPGSDGWVIVEGYDSKEEAAQGHERWVQQMVNNPPAQLVDCENSGAAEMVTAFGGSLSFSRISKEDSNID